MSILEFVPQIILENLDADPRRAFLQIVESSQNHYNSVKNKFPIMSIIPFSNVNYIKELRLEFASVILASATKLGIDDLSHIEIEDIKQYYDKGRFDYFRSELNTCITNLYLDLQRENYDISVAVSQGGKNDITSYLNALRECVNNADISASKKDSLQKKLDDFEKELAKKRINIAAVTIVVLEIMALPGGVWASYEVANKLIINIVQTIAEARAKDQDIRALSAPDNYKALPPPVSEKPQRT